MLNAETIDPEVARQLGQSIANQEWGDVMQMVHPDVIAHIPAEPKPLRGIEALAGFIVDTDEKADHGEHFEVIDTLVGTHHAAVYFRITAQRAGRPPLDNLTVHLARFVDGQVAEIWFHNFDNDAVADFWA